MSETRITAGFQLKGVYTKIRSSEATKGSAVTLRRSKLDIVLSVLSAVRDGADKPTRIMYAANLSWRPTKKIIASLVEQGLLAEFENTASKRSKKMYEVTEKGLNIIRYFKDAPGLIDIEEILTRD